MLYHSLSRTGVPAHTMIPEQIEVVVTHVFAVDSTSERVHAGWLMTAESGLDLWGNDRVGAVGHALEATHQKEPATGLQASHPVMQILSLRLRPRPALEASMLHSVPSIQD